jgi:hypothetical protein
MRFATKNPDQMTETEYNAMTALALIDARITEVFCYPPFDGSQSWGFEVESPTGRPLSVWVESGPHQDSAGRLTIVPAVENLGAVR